MNVRWRGYVCRGALGIASMSLVAAAASASCGRTAGRCEDDATSFECVCAADRRRDDGSCCARWTHFSPSTRTCDIRAIARPAALRDLGPTGARAIAAAVDDHGRAVLAWEIVENGVTEVLVGDESADGSVVVVRAPAAQLAGSSLQPSVAAGPGRNAMVAWKQVTGVETAAVHVSERSDAGLWRDPQRPDEAFSFPPRAYEPALATTSLGETVLVWNQWADSIYGVQVATRPRDGTWLRPSSRTDMVSPNAWYSNAPTPVTSSRGDVLVTWYQALKDANLSALYSERRGPSGSFSHANGDVRLSPPGGDVGGSGGGNPKPALGPRGEAACAWLQKDDDRRLAPFVAFREPDGEWKTPTSTRESLGLRTGNASSIRAAFGARGSLIVAWTQDIGNGPALYALRRSPSGAWQGDPNAPVVLSSPGAAAQNPVLSTGTDGAIVLAWIEIDQAGSALRIRRSWDDDADWGAIETLASPDRVADSPAIALGGARGRVVIAWTEGRAARVQVATIE